MKKQIVTICLFTSIFTGYSQNKKEQLETLKFSLDSCKTIVESQKKQLIQISDDNKKCLLDFGKSEDELKKTQNQLLDLQSEIKKCQKSTDSLKVENDNLKNPRIFWNGNYGEVILENGEVKPKITISNQTIEGFDYKVTFTNVTHDPFEFRIENHFGHASFFNSQIKAKSLKLKNEDGNIENIEIVFTLINDEIFIDFGKPSDSYGEFIQYESILCKQRQK